MSEPKKTIVINPDFLKLPMKGNRTRKANVAPKPIKIRTEKPTNNERTIKRRALNYIKKQQEARYKRMSDGLDEGVGHRVEGKSYAEEFKSDFDDSLSFLQKLTDQNADKAKVHNATLRQYPTAGPSSTLFTDGILNQVLDQNISLEESDAFKNVTNLVPSPAAFPMSPLSPLPPIHLPKPTYGCLKGGTLPTYRTMKAQTPDQTPDHTNAAPYGGGDSIGQNPIPGGSAPKHNLSKLTPEQQRAELKQFLNKRKEEKQRVERVKRQRHIMKPNKKQKRTTTRTFRVGKSKHYAKVGVLIPNKTIRTQILAKKQQIRETPLQDIRKHLIKKGLIRVGSSCPNDVLRQMYESSMMMCGEIQNHNADNLLYNYLHNGI
jgi:hypothetical protein